MTPAVAGRSTEARRLAEQARVLFEDGDDANRENFSLAEELLKKAVSLDPADGEVMAIYAQLSTALIRFGFDRSQARQALAQSQAERAVKLAPGAFEPQFALAYFYRLTDAREAERILRELLRMRPKDKRLLRTLGLTFRVTRRREEAMAAWREAAELPGSDAWALREIGLELSGLRRWTEAERALDRSLEIQPMVRTWFLKIAVQLHGRGDLDGALTSLQKIPAWGLLEDRGAFLISQIRSWRREPAAALLALNRIPRDYLEDNWFSGPKSFLIGQAQQLAGRMEAARAEWQNALALVEKRLVDEPRSTELLYWRAQLLASLGRTADAKPAVAVYDQSTGAGPAKRVRLAKLAVTLGDFDAAFEALSGVADSEAVQTGQLLTHHDLRLDPTWDPLRNDSRYEKLLEEVRKANEQPSQSDRAPTAVEPATPEPRAQTPATHAKFLAALAFSRTGQKEAAMVEAPQRGGLGTENQAP